MTDHIKLRKANGVWVVRAGGAVLGESRNVIEVTEGDTAPVMYFPRADIAMVFLEPGQTVSHCPHKGAADYFSISVPGETLTDAVWSYATPPDALARIAGHLAFYPDKVTVEQL